MKAVMYIHRNVCGINVMALNIFTLSKERFMKRDIIMNATNKPAVMLK